MQTNLSGWAFADVEVQGLDGPPPYGFDCGREEQNRFLYDNAWNDQDARLSTTYLFRLNGMVAAYLTILMDSVRLHRKERGVGVRFRQIGALKSGQLGVHRRFHGNGLGRFIVFTAIEFARSLGTTAGCRYLILDAQPDLVTWYERHGFQRNELMQAERRTEAERHGRDPERIPVSMRFDLREEL